MRTAMVGVACAGSLFLAAASVSAAAASASPFQERGYYITFMRMPTYDLADWKHIVDNIRDDGGNLLLLWMGGGFRSKKFPVTWQYNEEHHNVRRDFVRELIDHAHTRGIRVLLGFTPFGYDGVNRYPLEHPELKATGQDGQPTAKAGIGCWGYNLCPSKSESQRFMLEYVREMFFDFYPNADGLMIESSDYAICHCSECGPRFFEKEFNFVRQISEEVWAKKPEAMIVVYPHYFSGAVVPGFGGVRAAKLPFDPRWTLFFTPHSAHFESALIRQARHSLWWDESPSLRRPRDIQQSALRARNAGVTGYIPSLEAFSFVATEAEEGQSWLKGRRQVPLGFGWLKEGEPPYDELPMRVNRLAYREFSRNPDLTVEQFKETLGREVFGNTSTSQLVDDLLVLQAVFNTERTWCQPSPLVCPERVREMKSQGKLTPQKQGEYRAALVRLRAIEARHPVAQGTSERELLRITRWVLSQWEGEDPSLLGPAASGSGPASGGALQIEVPRWQMHEFELHGRCLFENPFRDAALTGEFTAPSGRTLRVEGFHDGGDTWRLRFAPNEEGEWRYRLHGEGVEISQEGRLKCVLPRGHGPIRIHPENPYAFAHANGTAFFPMGDTCYGLYDDSPITPALRREYLETRRRQRFNFVRMSVGHSEARAAADPAFWAWGGTPAKPDLDRLNPVFFRGLDALFRDLRTRGMNVELLLLNFYRRPFTDTKLWTAARERLWLRYVVARYAAFDNLFLWTLANEYETHPDGSYRLDLPGDVTWAKATARLVKQFDPFRHPVTVHPVISSSTRGNTPRSEIDQPWRIGGFFGEGDELDVLSQQTGQWGDGVLWDQKLQCWVGDDPNLVASLRADRRFRKPVLNTESGYEYLRGHPTERQQVHHTDKVRHSAWRIVCAGGYFAAGFHGTIGHSDAWNRIDPTHHYSFDIRDEGAAAQLGLLHDFFAALPFWQMQPFDGVTGAEAVALAESGKFYAIYLPHGGKMSVNLSAAKEPLTAQWFNPRDGTFGKPFTATAGKPATFQAPDAQDWVLRLCENRSRP